MRADPVLARFAADRPPELKPYDSLDFRTVEDGQNQTTTKTGKTCRQSYTLKKGIPVKTDLEIMQNYAQALPQEGWTITNTKRDENGEVFATQAKDGVESWVHVWPANGDRKSTRLNSSHVLRSRMPSSA